MKPSERYLKALVKYARLQDVRARQTHFGLASETRQVYQEFPADIPHENCPVHAAMDAEERSRKLQIIRDQLREYTSDPSRLELLERRLVEGESLKHVAEDLGLSYEAAKANCRRAKQFLGITETRPGG